MTSLSAGWEGTALPHGLSVQHCFPKHLCTRQAKLGFSAPASRRWGQTTARCLQELLSLDGVCVLSLAHLSIRVFDMLTSAIFCCSFLQLVAG